MCKDHPRALGIGREMKAFSHSSVKHIFGLRLERVMKCWQFWDGLVFFTKITFAPIGCEYLCCFYQMFKTWHSWDLTTSLDQILPCGKLSSWHLTGVSLQINQIKSSFWSNPAYISHKKKYEEDEKMWCLRAELNVHLIFQGSFTPKFVFNCSGRLVSPQRDAPGLSQWWWWITVHLEGDIFIKGSLIICRFSLPAML